MRIGHLEAMAAALLLLAPAAGNGADASFAYQGQLLGETGQVLAARNHSIEFRIYDQASGGSALWSCTRSVVLSEKGNFSVELSGTSASGVSLGEVFAANASRTLYIALAVDGENAEVEPRQRLLSVPKALWAADAVGAQDDIAVSSNLVAAAADMGDASARSLTLTGAMRCEGTLMPGALAVSGNVNVSGSITGNGAIPVGGIVVWNGSSTSIPDGWALCDGQTSNGRKTPNLSDKFVIAAGSKYPVGAQGGAETATLTLAQMPPHRHAYKFKGADSTGGWDADNVFYDATNHYRDNDNTRYTEYTGGDDKGKTVAHDNMPPYYALCYIMRVK